jgi:hypothetical protein
VAAIAATGAVVSAQQGARRTLSGEGSGALNEHSLLANLMWALPRWARGGCRGIGLNGMMY